MHSEVVFSYIINGVPLLDSLAIPLETTGSILIVGGTEIEYSLVGGILEQAIPIESGVDWEPVKRLMPLYIGDLTISGGQLPSSATYVGPDPEQFLFMSRVEEELDFRSSSREAFKANLESFGLNDSYLKRKFSELSGGEKMKIILSLTFAAKSECLILHGTVPWLDDEGRQVMSGLLLEQKKSKYIIIFEHEFQPLLGVCDNTYVFHNSRLEAVSIPELTKSSGRNYLFPLESEAGPLILQFRNVCFRDYVGSSIRRPTAIIDDVSFDLYGNEKYAMVGANGSGKSTLAKLICKIVPPDTGSIDFCKKSLVKYDRMTLLRILCYVSQFPNHQIIFNDVRDYADNLAKKGNTFALSKLGEIFDLSHANPISRLTVYQKKLLLLISFVSESTQLVVLDEPSWGLSECEIRDFMKFLVEFLQHQVVALLIITHDSRLVPSFDIQVDAVNSGSIRLLKSSHNRTNLHNS